MKKNPFDYQQRNRVPVILLLPATAIFLLQSCCFLGPAGIASKQPCNCKPANDVYAANRSTNINSGRQAVTAHAGSELADMNNTAISLTDQSIQSMTAEARVAAIDISSPEMLVIEPLTGVIDNIIVPTSKLQSYAHSLKNNGSKRYAEKKMPLGIKAIQTSVTAGPNLSFKTSKENYGGSHHQSKPGVGFQFGFATSYYFSDKFAVAPALLFKNNNATETISYGSTNEPTYGGGTSQEYETNYSYSYLSVPILAELHINEQLTIMAGPELNLLMSAHTKLKSGGNSEKTDIKNNSVKTGVGAQVGVKYVIPNTAVGIQLLYDHRISRLNEKGSDDYGGSYDTPAWNMKSIQLGVTCALCDLLHGGKK